MSSVERKPIPDPAQDSGGKTSAGPDKMHMSFSLKRVRELGSALL